MDLYGLIGYPLDHSFSEKYFREKFIREGIMHTQYKAFPLSEIGLLKELLIEHPSLKGFNVTIPYKEKILTYLSGLSVGAQVIGAVNTVRILRRSSTIELMGYNTDAYGFEKLLSSNFKTIISALILGTGGAAKAVEFVLKQLNISYQFVSRNQLKNEVISYGELNESHFRNIDLIINTTPLGQFPNLDQMPDIPIHLINEKHAVIDLIYNPKKTMLLKEAEKRGAFCINGYQMLVEQAEEAWRIWNG